MSEAKLLCVYDEGAKVNTNLIGGKGFGVLVDVDGQRTLFDTGLRGRYLVHNLSMLDVKESSVDRIVLSHAAMDHIGGLASFLDNRKEKIDVYANPSVWGCKRLIRPVLPEESKDKVNKIAIDGWIQLSDHLFITAPINDIADESVLVITSQKGAIVLTACSHGGILDTLSVVSAKFGKIRTVIGGVHLNKVKQPVVDIIADELKSKYGMPMLYLNACSTSDGIQKMRLAVSIDGVRDFFVGDELKFTL